MTEITPDLEAEASEGEGDPGKEIPIHRVALRTLLGGVVAGGLALLPLGGIAVLADSEWAGRHWFTVLLGTLVSAACFACAETMVRRGIGWRRGIPLLAFGLGTLVLVAFAGAWFDAIQYEDDPYEALIWTFELLQERFRDPRRTAALILASAIPFVLACFGRTRSQPGARRLLESLGMVCLGGASSTGLLMLYLDADLFPMGLFFWAMPTAVVAGLTLVDYLEPPLVDWMAGLGGLD